MHRTVDHGYEAKAALPAQRLFEGLLASAESYNRGPALIVHGRKGKDREQLLVEHPFTCNQKPAGGYTEW